MNPKNLVVLLVIIVIFTLSLLTVLPIDKGLLGGKGILLGLDLQGGIHLVYKVDLSNVLVLYISQPGFFPLCTYNIIKINGIGDCKICMSRMCSDMI